MKINPGLRMEPGQRVLSLRGIRRFKEDGGQSQDSTILFSLYNPQVLDQGLLDRPLRLSFFRLSLHSLHHSGRQYGANLSSWKCQFLLEAALPLFRTEEI